MSAERFSDPLEIVEIALQHDIAENGPLPVAANKIIDRLGELGLSLRKAQAISPPVRTARSSRTTMESKICAQNFALWLSTTARGSKPGIDHFEQVLVLEVLGDGCQPDRIEPLGLE